MTEKQIRKMAKQLRAGADGYLTLRKAINKCHIGDQVALKRAAENMERLQRELDELAWKYENETPEWMLEVTP